MPAHLPEEKIAAIFATLFENWGPQHWWPAQSRFEVIVGAYLTQNTSWSNVEIALGNLRRARVLSVRGIRDVPIGKLEQLIRASGYFRQKARSLKTFVSFLDETYGGSLTKMFSQPTSLLREQLLALKGVGPETADSILLYAGQHPVFVVDAYTKRLGSRHGILTETSSYEEFRNLFERALNNPDLLMINPFTKQGGTGVFARSAQSTGLAAHKPSRMSTATRSPVAQVFNEMHGLIVSAGKQYCLKAAGKCAECPVGPLLEDSNAPRRS
jgi:endonuclease-3 related protein